MLPVGARPGHDGAWLTFYFALAVGGDMDGALDRYRRERRSHLRTYQFMSRWLTPLFQSDGTGLAWWRDTFFGPLARMPGARSPMLKILTGEAGRTRAKA